MKTLFNLTTLVLIIASQVFSQESSTIKMDEIHTIFDESYTTDSNTTLVLDLKYTGAKVYKSKDDNVHITYVMEFKNYRKKIIKSRLEQVNISGEKESNKITFTSNSRNSKFHVNFRFQEILAGRFGKIKDTANVEKPIIKKSLDSVLNQIRLAEKTRLRQLYGTLKIKPRVKKWKKSDKIQITRLEIFIPDHIKVRIVLENSQLVFNDDFSNQAIVNSRNSKLRFKALGNNQSSFDIDNGYFNVEAINGGNYSFKNTKESTIGRLENTSLSSEFSKIEIGEVSKNNSLEGFNNKWIFHNFSDSFNDLEIQSEYSEINMFYPQISDYSLTTFGSNTVHYVDGKVQTYSTKHNESVKMYELTKGEPSGNSNKITINSQHGIIRLAKDNIQINQN